MAICTHTLELNSLLYDVVKLNAFGNGNYPGSLRGMEAFAFEAWVKVGPNSTDVNQRMWCEMVGGNTVRFGVSPVIGTLQFSFCRTSGTTANYRYSRAGLFNDDRWHHIGFSCQVVAEYHDAIYSIFVDGVQVASGVIRDSHPVEGNGVSDVAASSIWIGATPNGPHWDGKIGEVRLWSNLRSAGAILEDKDDFIDLESADLFEVYRFNEGTGTSIAGEIEGTGTGTIYRNGVASSALWTIDRPFLGEGGVDLDGPTAPVMLEPTNITPTGFTLAWEPSEDDVYVQFYEVTLATNAAFTNVHSYYSALNVGRDLGIDIIDVNPNTNYYARVRAVDSSNNVSDYGVWGSPTAITTLPMASTVPPTTPVAVAATGILQESFIANWNSSSSVNGLAGYKIDVARDSGFVNYLPNWRNVDVGNTTSVIVAPTVPRTQYWYRVRAYDILANESPSSNVVTVQTLARPDTTAPQITPLLPATSITSSRFTANWLPAVDDVGVVGYYLDVSLDSTFENLLPGYNNLNVGNVTSYGVVALEPDRSYWYRVRAYDAAGNIGPNGTSIVEVFTASDPSGGYGIVNHIVYTTQRGQVSEATPDTPVDTSDEIYFIDGTEDDAKIMLLEFDFRDLPGEVTSAMFSLGFGEIEEDTVVYLHVIKDAGWDDTVTWNTRPTTADDPAIMLPVEEEVAFIDLVDHIDGRGLYTVAVSTNNGPIEFDFTPEEEGEFLYLEVETDTTASTRIEEATMSVSHIQYTNYLYNPSAESGVGGATTITRIHGDETLDQDDSYAAHGTYSAKVVTDDGVSDVQGVKFASTTGLDIENAPTLWASVAGRANTSLTLDACELIVRYTDETDDTTGAQTITLTPDWQRHTLPPLTPNPAKTVDEIVLVIGKDDPGLVTFWADAAMVTDNEHIGYFDGNTVGASWQETGNASPSFFFAPRIEHTLTYIGDSNDTMGGSVRFKRLAEEEWFDPQISGTPNHGAKRLDTQIGGVFGLANMVENPSFEDSTALWQAEGSNVTLGRTLINAAVGGASAEVALDLDDSVRGIVYGAGTDRRIYGTDDDTFQARAMLWATEGVSIRLVLRAYDVTNVLLDTAYSEALDGDETWQPRFIDDYTPPATTYRLTLACLTTSDEQEGIFALDAVQIIKGEITRPPYLDGAQPGGRWNGTPHLSSTWRTLEYEDIYDVEYTVVDDDGVIGSNPGTTQIETGVAPTTVLITGEVEVNTTDKAMYIDAHYDGDDDNTAEAIIEWRRADLSTWSRAVPVYDRAAKVVRTRVTSLSPGTAYQVRVTYISTTVYGMNPITKTVVTGVEATQSGNSPFISFGGFVLQGESVEHVWVQEHDSYSHPERRLQVDLLSRLDGGVELENLWGTRTVTMRGGVSGVDRADFFANIETLKKALSNRRQRLVIDSLADTGRYYIATCANLAIREVAGQNFVHTTWDAAFLCADPFKYDASETSEIEVNVGHDAPVAIVNSGDLDIAPTFTITTESPTNVNLQLTNRVTGERILPAVPIKVGDTLVVDTSRLSLTKNGVEVDYAGGFPRLMPGSNDIVLRLTPDTARVFMTVRRRHRYL